MPANILIAPAAAGKTRYCLERLRQVLEARDLAPAWLVVPDSWHVRAYGGRLAAQGGAIGGKITTFRDLYREILELSDQRVPLVPEATLYRLVANEVEKAYTADRLNYYGEICQTPGFVMVLRERFAEFKRALVLPGRLEAVAAEYNTPLQEMAALYTAYQAKLEAYRWADLEGLGWLAVEALETNPQLAADWAILAVDGFNDFTGTQLRLLGILSQRVGEMLITLPGAAGSGRPVFERSERALERLSKVLSTTVATATELPYLPAELARLEATLFTQERQHVPVPPPGNIPGNVTLLEVSSPEIETREALRWIKACLLREGLTPGDCAIFVPNLDRYRSPLQAIADEFDLRLRFTQGARLATVPPVAAVLQLLEVPRQNFTRRLVLESLRNPYFSWVSFGLSPEDVDVLERVSLAGQVIAGWEQWAEVLTSLTAVAHLESENPDPEGDWPQLPYGPAAEHLKSTLGAIVERLVPPQGLQSIDVWVSWLQALLEELHYYEHGIGESDQQAFEDLDSVFRGLALSALMNEDSQLDFVAFFTELQGALEAAGFDPYGTSQRRAKRSEILVARLIEARSLRFTAVAVLGLSEGVFPEVERPDPFIPENVRAELGLEKRLGRGQAGIFYQVVTRANRLLLLSRPYLSPEGEPWLASPYWSAVCQALGNPTVRRVRPDDPRPLVDAASTQELLFWAVQRAMRRGDRSAPDAPEVIERWTQLMHARQILGDRLARSGSSHFDGDLADLAVELQAHFSPAYTWSASRLEAYLGCPLSFWAGSVLGLDVQKPPELGFDAAQLGSMLHEILEQVYQAADDPADPEAVLARLPEVAARVFQHAPKRHGFRPSQLWEVEQAQLYTVLERTIEQLGTMGAGWYPLAYEQVFGMHGQPALEFNSLVGTIRVRGVIDRLDTNATGSLRVVDYKTGGSHLGKRDLVSGQRLQLPLYALAAWRALEMGEPVEGLYWQILAAKAGSLRLSNFSYAGYTGVPGAIELAIEHVGRAVAGVRAGAFTPQPPVDGCPEYCPAASWCWHYQPGR